MILGTLLNGIKYFIVQNRFKKNVLFDWKDKQCIRPNLELSPDSFVSVGANSSFGLNCSIRVRNSACLSIGRNFGFNNNCTLICREKINIGDNVMVGPNSIIIDNDHDFRSKDYTNTYKTSPIIIEDNVWIGANVCILRGSVIKKGAVIAAGTVVKGIVDENVIYMDRQNIERIKYFKHSDEGVEPDLIKKS